MMMETQQAQGPPQLWHAYLDRLEGLAEVLARHGLRARLMTPPGRVPSLHVVNPHTGGLAGELRSVTLVGRELGRTDALATAAVAMGRPALTWLAGLDGYESLVVTEDATLYRSDHLPEVGGFSSS